jgi:hypothetical protein
LKYFAKIMNIVAGWYAPLLLFGIVAYPCVAGRSWIVWSGLIWMIAYHLWGSSTINAYTPIFIQARYFTFIVPFAAVFLAATIVSITNYLRLALEFSFARRILLLIAIVASLGLIWDSFKIMNVQSGKMYGASDANMLAQAMDHALLNFDNPIVVGYHSTKNLSALFYSRKNPRIIFSPLKMDNKTINDIKSSKGFLFVSTPNQLRTCKAFLNAAENYASQIKDTFESEVYLAILGKDSRLIAEPIAKFYDYPTRLDAFLWQHNWRVAWERPKSKDLFARLYLVRLKNP